MWSDSSLTDVYRPTTCRAYRQSYIDPGQSRQPGAYSHDETFLTGLTVSLVKPREPPALTSLSATYLLGGICTHSNTTQEGWPDSGIWGWDKNPPKLNWPLISAAGKVAHPKRRPWTSIHIRLHIHAYTRTCWRVWYCVCKVHTNWPCERTTRCFCLFMHLICTEKHTCGFSKS